MASALKLRSAKNAINSATSTPPKSAAKQSTVEPQQSHEDLLEIISSMNKQLKKLDKLDAIEQHLKNVDSDIKDLKHAIEFQQQTTDELTDKQREQETRMVDIHETIKRIEQEKLHLERQIVDIRAHSMRNNLIFYNVPETKENDEPLKKVKSLLETKLGFSDANQVEIERAHRLGKARAGDASSRPLIAKFLRHQDKERILRASFHLKGTGLSIAEQFPKEINEKRKQLYPILKQAKANGQRAVLNKDKLFINGRLYRA